MPFPFLPGGALLAFAVLGGAFVAFGLVLRAIDRAALTVRRSIAPGIVDGLQDWVRDHEHGPRPEPIAHEHAPRIAEAPVEPPAAELLVANAVLDELDEADAIPTARVRRN